MSRAPALACALLCCALPAHANGSTKQESVFMDDPALVYGTPGRVESTLATLERLGVDRVRVSLYWGLVAPDAGSKRRPGFDARDPLAYPPGAWERYDRLVVAAARHGLRVMFTLTGPSPLWATGRPRRTSIEPTYAPDAGLFREFVQAAGRRYPQVDSWSVWNEPNHPGWLTPQWVGGRGGALATAPVIYRQLADAAWQALTASGHGGDEILVGELAPRGWDKRGLIQAMRPLEFVRELYCLDRAGRPYLGDQARVRLCPPDGRGFAGAHPALFASSGFAHHPYAFDRPPGQDDAEQPDNVPLAGLGRLTRTLDGAMRVHGVPRRMPVFITEYGYQTHPDPAGVRQSSQAVWLGEAEYLAYRDRRVATTAQFLLRDDGPLPGLPARSPRRWGSFQTGLMTAGGRAKRALSAYARPLFVTPRRVRRGAAVLVFARLRGGGRVPARVELRPQPRRSFRVLRQMTTNDHGFVLARVRLRRSGSIRVSFGSLHTRATRVEVE